jgi:hypothetical protein
MKNGKTARIIILIAVSICLFVSLFPYAKYEILTELHGKEFVDGYKSTNMLTGIEDLKVLEYSNNNAKVYYFSENKGGAVVDFVNDGDDWKYKSWYVVWSVTGSADGFIWPYIFRHGSKTSESTIVKQYNKNKESIRNITHFLSNVDVAEDECVQITKGLQIKGETFEAKILKSDGTGIILDNIDSAAQKQIEELFQKTKYYQIYTEVGIENSVIFETASYAWYSNGIVVTTNGKPPEHTPHSTNKLVSIEDNVYYWDYSGS